MNGHELRMLAERADTVTGRADQRLAELHLRIRAARRRRAAAAAAAASGAVLAVVVTISVLTGTTGTRGVPIPPATSPTSTAAGVAAARPVVYGEGWPIRTVHIGDRTLDIGDLLPGGPNTPVYLNTTDSGVVITVDDDTSRIWFTDGTEVVPIGQVGAYTHIGSSRIATGTTGSLAAWPEWSDGSTTLVIFDTATRVELTRVSCPACGSPEIVGNHVYWAGNEDVSRDLTTMFDAVSGETSRVPATAYAADLTGLPRSLALGDSLDEAVATNGRGVGFAVQAGHLVALSSEGPQPTTVFDARSGNALTLRLPGGPETAQTEAVGEEVDYTVFDWLDDDRLALVADSNPGDEGWQIIVCRISTEECDPAAPPTPDRRWAANLDFP